MSGRIAWGKPGSKVTRRTEARVRDRGLRQVVVTVYPDGIIGLRAMGTRKEEYVEVAGLWMQAVRLRVAAERAAKRKAKKK